MRRWILGRSRWVAPSGTALAALAAAWIGVAAVVIWTYAWSRRAAPGPEVLAAAATAVDPPIALEAAMDVAWRFAMDHAAAGSWTRVAALDPPLPPPLCASDDTTGFNRAVRDLEQALASGSERVVERRLAELRRTDPPSIADGALIRTLSLARGHLAAGDAPTAAQLLDPPEPGPLLGDRVPVLGPDVAMARVVSGAVEPDHAALAAHARYLAGLAALRRGRSADAIPHLRFAVNALAYLVPPADASTASSARSRRLTVDLGRFRCGFDERGGGMDSMDAYVALVAAYLRADDFTDPPRLEGELRRGALEIDPGDPLAPVLSGALEGRLDVDEHVLWAASNLQRLEHHNRIRPDPRLALARGLVVLRLTDPSGPLGESQACEVLSGMAPRAAPFTGMDPEPGPIDRARAGVTLTVLARRARRCGSQPPLDEDLRSRLLQWGGGSVAGGLPGRLETARVGLQRGLAGGGATRADFARSLAGPRSDGALLRKGRIPSDLLRGLDTRAAAEAVAEWERAVYADVARALVPLVGSPAGTHRPASESRRILSALGGAVAHAGLKPSRLYGAEQVVWAARSGGAELIVPHLARFGARSYPLSAVVVCVVLFLAGALAGLWLHVSWWRYELATSRRFYVTETLARWKREMATTASPDDWGESR